MNLELEDVGGSFNHEDAFEPQRFPCYALHFTEDEVHVMVDNKTMHKIDKNSFPQDIDLSDVGQIAEMLKVIREDGLKALLDNYQMLET